MDFLLARQKSVVSSPDVIRNKRRDFKSKAELGRPSFFQYGSDSEVEPPDEEVKKESVAYSSSAALCENTYRSTAREYAQIVRVMTHIP